MTSDHLEQFRCIFPLVRVNVCDIDMRYPMRNMEDAKYFEDQANRIIIENLLRLKASIDVWSIGEYIRGIELRIEYVPEMYLIER